MARMDETYFKTYYPVFKPPGETTDMTHQILTETAAMADVEDHAARTGRCMSALVTRGRRREDRLFAE